MLTLIAATCFKQIQKTLQIRFDVGMRILDRVTHASLSCEVNYLLKSIFSKQNSHCCAISKIGRYRAFPIAGTAVTTVE